ncbi:MAG: hypothetical protein II035_00325 [Firmicutes bacterium]|nr:hypothetical protein [Bacillota bacterium]
MAKFETVLKDRTFDEWVQRIENGILGRSASATLEDKSDFIAPDGRSNEEIFGSPIFVL